MRISIITPCYNSENSIKDTIDSILYQKGNFDIEYIVVDGNSKDRTTEIVNNYINDLNNKCISIKCNNVEMKLISENDFGMYDALKKGFKMITGDIVAYINADDHYMPSAFSTVIEIFSKFNDVKWITGNNLKYNEKGQIITSYNPFQYDRKLILDGIYGTKLPFIQQESTFWKKELLKYLDYSKLEKFKLAGDYYLWHTFAQHEQLFIIDSFLAGFTKRKGQLSGQINDYYYEFEQIRNKDITWNICKTRFYKYNKYIPNRVKRKFRRHFIKYSETQDEWLLY